MTHFTPEQIALLEHINNNGFILNSDGPIADNPTQVKILINVPDGTSYIEYPLDEALQYFTIYHTPEQLRIQELEQQIADLTAQLNKPKRKVPVQYKHLTNREVQEIEQIFVHKPEVDKQTICLSYGSSRTVIDRIFKGEHTKSSSNYISHLQGLSDEQTQTQSAKN